MVHSFGSVVTLKIVSGGLDILLNGTTAVILVYSLQLFLLMA